MVEKEALAPRLLSLDIYRGMVMFLMLAEGLEFCGVAGSKPGVAIWEFLCTQQSHVEWRGCTLHDLIQPSFSFLVGAALPFSLASRRRRGESTGWGIWHAAYRAIVLIFLGIFLRSLSDSQTNFTFEDTLTQIGLGYGLLYGIGHLTRRGQWIAIGSILVGYWLLFACYPLPGADFSYPDVGVPADWPHLANGFAAHWNKNSNPAWAFDTWFLNLFPREEPFRFNGGGYSTLSFIPTLGTMVMGLLAGGVLQNASAQSLSSRLRWFITAGFSFILLGILLDKTAICPSVKRIWTPSFALYSGGWCLWILGSLHAIADESTNVSLKDGKIPWWWFPWVVIGRNSIAIYLMSWTLEGFIKQQLVTHLGNRPFEVLGTPFHETLLGATTILVMWLILYWMHERKIFLRM
jgi:heparan-alpha-glucosaminide N-acetyltransferase